MSIISDALKKAQNLSKKESPPQESTPGQESTNIKKPEQKRHPRHLRFIFGGFIISVFILLGVFAFYYLTGSDIKTAERMRENIQNAFDSAKEAKEPVPSSQIPDTKKEAISPSKIKSIPAISLFEINRSLKLSGIMHTPKKPLAVINDNIWSEGDSIGKFKILEIGKDYVKVSSGEQEFIIRLKR